MFWKIVPQYKYPGLILSEHLDYNVVVKSIVLSASRALGSLKVKFKSQGGLPCATFTRLFDALIWPIMDYSASIWGTCDFSCVDNVFNQACRFFLGVGKYTPVVAIRGEMDWKTSKHRKWLSVTGLLCRIQSMSNVRINKRIFDWSVRMWNNTHNWYWRVKQQFQKLNIQYYLDAPYASNVIISQMDAKMGLQLVSDWKSELNRVAAKTGNGRNKLRSYSKFKETFCVELYVVHVASRSYRSAMAKFRCVVAPIQLELGRFFGQQESERLCPTCHQDVASVSCSYGMSHL